MALHCVCCCRLQYQAARRERITGIQAATVTGLILNTLLFVKLKVAAEIRQSLMKRSCTVFLFLFSPGIDLVTSEESKQSVLPRGASWAVHKFGGTCVGTSERIKNVAEIIVADPSVRKVAVVSAMSKVTDMMYDLLHRAQARDESYNAALDKVHEKHKETAMTLLQDGGDLRTFLAALEADVQNLRAMLKAIYIGML
jgi:hypothetical protein